MNEAGSFDAKPEPRNCRHGEPEEIYCALCDENVAAERDHYINALEHILALDPRGNGRTIASTRDIAHTALSKGPWAPTTEASAGSVSRSKASTGDGLTMAESHCATCDRCQAYRKMADDEARRHGEKWQEYERDYILPCFTWAKEVGIDLDALVREKAGRNCVDLLVHALIDRVSRPEAQPTGPLSEEVARIVHAFPDDGRKQAVRELAAKVAVAEAARDRWKQLASDARERRDGEVRLAAAIVANNASTAALIGFVSWVANHPDVGDSCTAVEREEQFKAEAKKVLAGDGEAWVSRERAYRDPCHYPGCHGGDGAHIAECPNASDPGGSNG